MGIDCRTFDHILQNGFTQRWNTHPIFRDDVEEHAITRPNWRSLDAAGGLALILHYLNSTMAEVTLQQVFSLVPAVCSLYLTFSLHQLLSTLRHTRSINSLAITRQNTILCRAYSRPTSSCKDWVWLLWWSTSSCSCCWRQKSWEYIL